MMNNVRKLLFVFLAIGIFILTAQFAAAQNEYIPDAQIRHSSAISYTGEDVYYPTAQITSSSVANLSKAIYYIRFQNDGYLSRTYSVSGSAGNSGWTVSYYNSGLPSGGTDITISIIDGSWLTGPPDITPAGTKTIRLEVTPDTAVEGGTMFPIDIIMSDRWSPPVTDVVRAETTCTLRDNPDIQIKESSAVSYTGNGVYNTTAAGQTLSASINNTRVVSYYIKLENDGNVTTAFTITGSASTGGWIITYYDAPDGGNDITITVTGLGWLSNVLTYAATQEIRVEVSPGLSVSGGNIKDVYIAMMSPAVSDVVRTTNTCIQGAVVQVNYASAHPASSSEFNDTPKLSMLQFEVYVPSGNEGVWVNNISLKASGSGSDNSAISGVRLIRDSNANGFYDLSEQVLGGPATYSENDATLVLTLSPSLLLPVCISQTWLVVYQMSGLATVGQTFNLQMTVMEIKGQYSLIPIYAQTLPLSSQTKTIGDYTVSTTTGTAPLNVAFNGQFGTKGSVVRYEIDFDYDEQTFRPTHQSIFSANTAFNYTTAGSHIARLRITYLDGSVIYRNFTIILVSSSNSPQIDPIIKSPGSSGQVPFAVTLTANANPVSGVITAYLWDFDGNNIIDYVSTVSWASHTYTKVGSYQPVVWVQNTLGLTANRNTSIWGNTNPLAPAPTAVIDLPASDITATAGDNVLFSGSGIPAAGGVIAKYEWDFDNDDSFDISDAILSKTYYTFLYPGTYNVKLRVTENSGSAPAGVSAETIRTVIVQPSLSPRVIITQAGQYKVNKDALREDVDGRYVTVKVVPICFSRINRIDFRYRKVDTNLPDTFVSPADDPLPIEITTDFEPMTGWATSKLSITTTCPADIKQECFIATIRFSSLSTDNWYEIIAMANFNPANNTYDDWNAGPDRTQTRVFLRNVGNWNPEIREGTSTEMTAQLIRTIVKRQNNTATKNDTTVFIPADGLAVFSESISMTIDTPTSVITPAEEGFSTINVFRDIKTDTQSVIKKLVQVKIGYPDINGDTIIDGTTISETTLSLCRYDTVNSKWVPLLNQNINYYNKTISGWTTEWGVFGIIGQIPPEEEQRSGSSALGVEQSWAFCFIATAAYGTPMAEEVKTLSVFRDKYLMTNPAGRLFVKTYYTVSPPIANFIAKRPHLRYITRQMLKPIVWAVKLIK